jgi:methyl-accepting chemotaxis protein
MPLGPLAMFVEQDMPASSEPTRDKMGAEQARREKEAAAESHRQQEVEELKRKAELDARTAAAHQDFTTTVTVAFERLAKGDLTCRLTRELAPEYEQVRANFNAAVEKLNASMLAVDACTAAIHSASGEISDASDDPSRRSEQQASSLEQSAAALSQITDLVKKTAEGASHANAVVVETRKDAADGGEVVGHAIDAMDKIEKSSQQIGQIIGVIDEIAFQTNLLALNAGVEAARAGDAGEGFAVVASEVRALAQRSADATKEIKTLISSSRDQVGQGVDLVAKTGKSLDQIKGVTRRRRRPGYGWRIRLVARSLTAIPVVSQMRT